MENKTELETQRWVDEKLALIAAPEDWQTDTGIARARLQGLISGRRSGRARIWLPRVAIVGLACLVLLLAIPKTRAWTQHLWQWLTVRKVDVVQADFDRLRGKWLVPRVVIKNDEEKEYLKIEPPPSLDLPQAAQSAGFWPRLPREEVLPGNPMITTNGPGVWSATLKAADLESSLREAGVDDQPIPKEWDGAQLEMKIGSALVATWGEERVTLLQHGPLTFSAPPDFDFAGYWMAALRAAGVSREQAAQLAERITRTPSLLLGIGADKEIAIREVKLRTGPAALIERVGKTGRMVILIWNDEDRVYHLNADSEAKAIRVANSIQ